MDGTLVPPDWPPLTLDETMLLTAELAPLFMELKRPADVETPSKLCIFTLRAPNRNTCPVFM